MDRNLFDKWAADYDASIARSSNDFPFIGYYDVLTAVVEAAAPKEGMRVLDVGIGTGALARRLREKGCVIYGVDFSPEMLKKAKLNIPDGNFDISDVPEDHLGKFSSLRFDRVVSSYFLHHFDPASQLEFINRIIEDNLNPGGSLVIADIGFATEVDLQSGFEEFRNSWESDEYYLCGENMVKQLAKDGVSAEYRQISACAGILICRPI